MKLNCLGLSSLYLLTVSLSVADAAGYVKFPVQVTTGNSESKNTRTQALLNARIDDSIQVPLVDTGYYYELSLSIGTPGQSFQVMIDTGSSDLWVLAASNPYCLQNGINNETYNADNEFDCSNVGGTFKSNASSTYSYENDEFSIIYGDKDFAKGSFGTDIVAIEDVNLSEVGFGVGLVANVTFSVLGIGLVDNEATNFQSSDSYTYRNLPALLKDQGMIDVNAYSLYLDAVDTSEASLLFGAVDSSKYTGGLWTVPLVNRYTSEGQPQLEFTVDVTSVAVNVSADDPVISDASFVGLLDSGTTLTYLPPTVFNNLVSNIGANYDSSVGAYVVTESVMDDTDVIFTFSGADIVVKLADASFSTSSTSSDGEKLYWIGFASSGDENFGILGDTFLRSAYVVYNLDALEISLGQASYDNSESNIEVISSTVPGAQAASLATVATFSASSTSASSIGASVVSSTSSVIASTTPSTSSGTTSVESTIQSTDPPITSVSTSSSESATMLADIVTTATAPSEAVSSLYDSLTTVAQTYASGTLTITEYSVITVCTRCMGTPASKTQTVVSASTPFTSATPASGSSVIPTSTQSATTSGSAPTGTLNTVSSGVSDEGTTIVTMTEHFTVYLTRKAQSTQFRFVNSTTTASSVASTSTSSSSSVITSSIVPASSSSSTSIVIPASPVSTTSPSATTSTSSSSIISGALTVSSSSVSTLTTTPTISTDSVTVLTVSEDVYVTETIKTSSTATSVAQQTTGAYLETPTAGASRISNPLSLKLAFTSTLYLGAMLVYLVM